VSQTSRSAATGPSDTVALRNLEIRLSRGDDSRATKRYVPLLAWAILWNTRAPLNAKTLMEMIGPAAVRPNRRQIFELEPARS